MMFNSNIVVNSRHLAQNNLNRKGSSTHSHTKHSDTMDTMLKGSFQLCHPLLVSFSSVFLRSGIDGHK